MRSSTTKTPRINDMEYTEGVSAPRETTERQIEGEIMHLPKKVFVCALHNCFPHKYRNGSFSINIEMALQVFKPVREVHRSVKKNLLIKIY